MFVLASGETGYILEVDLSYPSHLHKTHADFPLAPEHTDISFEMLSPYSKSLEISKTYKSRKLCQTFSTKKRYVLHVQILKFYLKCGLVVEKIHRIIKFSQSNWLVGFIDLNTNLRKSAKDEFERDLFKLMNNAIFGKTLQNNRKHRDIQVVTSEKKFLKLSGIMRFSQINYYFFI